MYKYVQQLAKVQEEAKTHVQAIIVITAKKV